MTTLNEPRDKIVDVIDKTADTDVPCIIENLPQIADAILNVLPALVKPLPLLERRNGYWGGKCSNGYQIAHTREDLFRVRLNGRVICKDIRGFRRASDWANAHHVAQVMAAMGIEQIGERDG